jgi:hypothetical protein
MVELLEKSYEASSEPIKGKSARIGYVKLYYLNYNGTRHILSENEDLYITNSGSVYSSNEFMDEHGLLNLINRANSKDEKVVLNENAFLKIVELLDFNIKQSKKENDFLDSLKTKLVNLLED